jgi:hypothetical protein
MAQASQNRNTSSPQTSGAGYLFGVPLGDLGFFTSLLMSFALGFAAFFAATFCAIIGILFYNTATHHAVDFALTYTRFGLPIGLLVLLIALGYLGTLWTRRKLHKA